MESILSWLVWNPDRNLFIVPFINRPVTWYGVLFALAFFFSYFIIRAIFFRYLSQFEKSLRKNKKDPKTLSLLITDRLTLFVILGTVIGARLGHVFFYSWQEYRQSPLDILKIWEGGLASHGAAIGILLAIIFFVFWIKKSQSEIGLLVVLDAIVIPAGLVATFIRVGNFINQEILGKPTEKPWGVIFVNPIEGIAGIPLHPVQIYEALFYCITFLLLIFLWKKFSNKLGTGFFSGIFFILVFTFRFFIEYLKLPQSSLIDEKTYGNMGQLLSIPFIVLGFILLFYSQAKKKAKS